MSDEELSGEPTDPIVVPHGSRLSTKGVKALIKGGTSERSVWCSSCQGAVLWRLQGAEMVAVCLDCEWADVSGISLELKGDHHDDEEDEDQVLRCFGATRLLDGSNRRCRMGDVDPLTMLCSRHMRHYKARAAERNRLRLPAWMRDLPPETSTP